MYNCVRASRAYKTRFKPDFDVHFVSNILSLLHGVFWMNLHHAVNMVETLAPDTRKIRCSLSVTSTTRLRPAAHLIQVTASDPGQHLPQVTI